MHRDTVTLEFWVPGLLDRNTREDSQKIYGHTPADNEKPKEPEYEPINPNTVEDTNIK